MPLTHHGEHLAQLTRLKISNVYLVREDDGLTVIDTSLPGSAAAIQAAAGEIGAPIRRIALTHAHFDHYGSLDALHRAVPDAEVLVSSRDARLLRGDGQPEPGEPSGRLIAGRPPAKTAPTRMIGEGDRVGSLEVVSAPGHTPGQMAFLDIRDRTLICGDAYLALGGLFVTTQPVLRFPFPALLFTWNRTRANDTARKLRELDPARLATGHGPVLERPAAEMDRAIHAAPSG